MLGLVLALTLRAGATDAPASALRSIRAPGPHDVTDCALRLSTRAPIPSRELAWDEIRRILADVSARIIDLRHRPRHVPVWNLKRRIEQSNNSTFHLSGVRAEDLVRPHVEFLQIEPGRDDSVASRNHERQFDLAMGRLAGLRESIDERRSQFIAAHVVEGAPTIRAFISRLDDLRNTLDDATINDEERVALTASREYPRRRFQRARKVAIWSMPTLFAVAGVSAWLHEPLVAAISFGAMHLPLGIALLERQNLKTCSQPSWQQRIDVRWRLRRENWKNYQTFLVDFEDLVLDTLDARIKSGLFGYLATQIYLPDVMVRKMILGEGDPVTDEELSKARRALQRTWPAIERDRGDLIDPDDCSRRLPLDVMLIDEDGEPRLVMLLRYAADYRPLEPAAPASRATPASPESAWMPGAVPAR